MYMSLEEARAALTSLRVSIARCAQHFGIETDLLKVLGKAYPDLYQMAQDDQGWNTLLGLVVERVPGVKPPVDPAMVDAEALADEALNAAVKLIQDRLGVTTGDTAGNFFSNERVAVELARYIKLEAFRLNEARGVFIFMDGARSWVVRLVRNGEGYGLLREGVYACIHKEDDPLVEFYDPNLRFKPFGQFVSRYYLSTIRDRRPGGLCLDGGVPAWNVSANCMERITEHLKGIQS